MATAAGTTIPRSISFTIQNGVGLEAYSVRANGSRQAVRIDLRCSPKTRKTATRSSITAAVRSSFGDGRGVAGATRQAVVGDVR